MANTVAVATQNSVHPIEVTNIHGETYPLSAYEGKVLLIVNTASKCGFTPQYEKLQEVWEKYQDQGLVVLGFPSDNFLNQEYQNPEEVQEFCSTRFKITFPLHMPVNVKGDGVHPLWKFLGDKKQNGLANATPWWNFQKYLIDRNGQLVHYAYPFASPTSKRFTQKIEKLLANV